MYRYRRPIAITLAMVSALPIMLAILLFSIRSCVFDLSFYLEEYDKHGSTAVIGVSEDDLRSITENIIGYIMGSRADLDMRYPVDGREREIFNLREKDHMRDVRDLIELSATAMFLLAGTGAALIVLSLMLAAPGGKIHYIRASTFPLTADYKLSAMGMGYVIGAFIFTVLSGFLVYNIVNDYTGAFIRFHILFFNNDRWLLDENTDILLMMMPMAFFEDISRRIATYFGLGVLVSMLVAVTCILPERIAASWLKTREALKWIGRGANKAR